MKPGGKRAEIDWAETPYPTTIVGSASSSPPESDHPVAVLWIPDPEQRHGWREFYVRRPEPQHRRSMGFRR